MICNISFYVLLVYTFKNNFCLNYPVISYDKSAIKTKHDLCVSDTSD